MKARPLALGLSVLACLSVTAALAPAPGAAPPEPQNKPARDQYEALRKKQDEAAEKKDDVRDFADQDPITKARVLAFKEWDEVENKGKVHWGHGSAAAGKEIGDVDDRTDDVHYHKFDHPRVQPRPGEPAWRTYINVKRDDPPPPEATALPVAYRPDDETWLNLKAGEPFPEPPPTTYQGPLHFDSVPLIRPPVSYRVTYVQTAPGIFPRIDPFQNPPGANMLPTIYSDVFDGDDKPVENSLPSSIEKRYNLHEGEPTVTPINPRSPTNDLEHVLETLYTLLTGSSPKHLWERLDRERYEETFKRFDKNKPLIRANKVRIDHYLAMALDIIEGREVPDRAYSGLPLLHHSGQRRVRRVVPVLNRAADRDPPASTDPLDDGQPIPAIAMGPNVVGGNARVHQVWYDGRIESDTMFLDWQGEYDGCRIITADYKTPALVPARGDNVAIIARIGGSLSFRVFDADRHNVFDKAAADLPARTTVIQALEGLVDAEKLWNARAMTREQRYRVLRALLPIVGKSDFEPRLTDASPVRLFQLKPGEEVPAGDPNESVVARVGKILHIRINGPDGKPALQTDERHRTSRSHWIDRLEDYADKHALWGKPALAGPDRDEVVRDLLAIIARGPLDHRLEDLNLPPIPPKVPWTVTYTIDVLDHGADDFATTTMFFDSHSATEAYLARVKALGTPKSRLQLDRQQFQTTLSGPLRQGDGKEKPSPKLHPQLPLVSMDQTFFPMRSGTRTVLTIKMPAPEYHNLTYTWGWRFHPPRAQAMENAAKRKFPLPSDPPDLPQPSLVEYERDAFTDDPETAVNTLADLAPAKRMWHAFRSVRVAVKNEDFSNCLPQFLDARSAFLEWKDRTHLPSGLRPDPDTDLTVVFANNTTYGQLRNNSFVELTDYRLRPYPLKVTLINADYFEHQYLNVEWGGNRGWEPQFKPTLPLAGSGTFFSFGRFHYQFNTPPGKISVEAARRFRADGTCIRNTDCDAWKPAAFVEPGVHRLWINLNHEPSRRLRFYQFDPTHHDVAIYSIH